MKEILKYVRRYVREIFGLLGNFTHWYCSYYNIQGDSQSLVGYTFMENRAQDFSGNLTFSYISI